MLEIKKTIDEDSSAAAICLEGRLDTVTSPQLEEAIKSSLEDIKELTIDMEKLEYISSAGLRVLLWAQKAMARRGQMKLLKVNETVMEIFEVTGFCDILTIED